MLGSASYRLLGWFESSDALRRFDYTFLFG